MEENKNNNHHRINIVIFVILFLIAILFEVYWILNYPDDIFLIIGIGLIAIIMGFFAFEGIMDTYMNVQKQRYEQNEMLIKTQKALYLATKKNSAMLETRSEQNIEAIKYLVMKMSENQQQMTSLIKENNEEIAKRIESSGSDFNNSDISELVEKLNKSNERLTKEVQAAITVNELVKSNAELVKNVREVLNQSANTMASVSDAWEEEPVVPEPEAKVEIEPEPEVTEAYSYMEEEAVETADELETEMDIEESGSLEIAEEQPEEEETSNENDTVYEPFEIPADDGGMLSEEEIAALFANL